MGRITSWLKPCFGLNKKEKENEESSMISGTKSGDGRRDGERLRRRETSSHIPTTPSSLNAEQCMEAIAMVASTVAAANAVIATANAAVAMCRRLIAEPRVTDLQTSAAMKIQSAYRGHLARRARRALKSLVRVQALFRGYMVRKRMQALMRAKQYYVHANRTYGLAHQSERSKQRLSQHSRRQSLSSKCQCPHGFSEPRDGEFHVASLPCNPDLKVMCDLRDATTGDPNVVHSEVSMKECEKYNKMKMAKGITRHKHCLRQQPSEGWSSIVNELRSRREGKNAGSIQDGSTRPPNPYEKMSVRRETPRQCRRILPLF